MTHAELTQKVLVLLWEEKLSLDEEPLADLIDQAIVQAEEGNLSGKVYGSLQELQERHWGIYADTSSAEHLIAGGMYAHDAKQCEEEAPRHGDRSSEIIALLNAIDQLSPK